MITAYKFLSFLNPFVSFFRPSDDRPLTTNRPRLVATINVPSDQPVTDVNLVTRENVDGFTVTVVKPNGDEVPVNDGEVYI